MPLSTSSSEREVEAGPARAPSSPSRALERAPVGNWTTAWIATLLLVGALLAGWEMTCRMIGFEPSFQSDARLWAMARRRAADGGRDSVALVGSSRVLLNVDLDTFEQTIGRAPVQLGVNGCTPLPFLAELAADSSFQGVVVCGVAPAFFFDQRALYSRRFAEFYEIYQAVDASPAERLDQALATGVQGTLVFRHPALVPSQLLAAARNGTWPAVPWVRVREDRDQFGNFDRADAGYFEFQEYFYENRKRPAGHDELGRGLAVVELAVARIQERGGEVVFVRFPTGGRSGESERRRFPRADYWERLASTTQAVAIHGDDYPTLRSFRFPDGSHLDYRDAPRFTRELLRIISGELSARGDARFAVGR